MAVLRLVIPLRALARGDSYRLIFAVQRSCRRGEDNGVDLFSEASFCWNAYS
jgi:hypothetical protein